MGLRGKERTMVRPYLFIGLFVATNCTLALLYPFSWTRFLIFVALYGLGTGIMLYLLFNPTNDWLVTNRSHVESATEVALTFDDGPDPVDTPRLLDLLRQKGIKATFFVVGRRADEHPEIVRRAWEEGHLIANHTWSHQPLFCFLPPWRLRQEIERGTESIRRACGRRPRYFRSPVGLRHPFLRPYLEQAGLTFVSWRLRSRDTHIRNAQRLAERIVNNAHGGDIILLHDHRPDGARAMLEALPGVIDKLRARGFEFVLAGSRGEAECEQR
jgi:peptidoglycan/xylan/chitin deacetylase (PgdA/CDA1 family)